MCSDWNHILSNFCSLVGWLQILGLVNLYNYVWPFFIVNLTSCLLTPTPTPTLCHACTHVLSLFCFSGESWLIHWNWFIMHFILCDTKNDKGDSLISVFCHIWIGCSSSFIWSFGIYFICFDHLKISFDIICIAWYMMGSTFLRTRQAMWLPGVLWLWGPMVSSVSFKKC